MGKCDANDTSLVIAFFKGNHAENNETAIKENEKVEA